MLRSFSTANVDRASRFGYWTDLSSELFCPLQISPARADEFDAEVGIDTLGSIAIARTYSAAARIERTERHLARVPAHRFSCLLAVRGSIHLRHRGHDIVLNERDCVLLDQHAPHSVTFADINQALGVQIHEETLSHLLPKPETYCGQALCGAGGLGDTLATMIESLWNRVVEGVPAGAGQALAHNVLELLALAYAVECRSEADEAGVRNARKAQIKRFIEGNLRDADLRVDVIAAFLRVSPRYVRMLFSDEPETVTAYIQRRRLERCADFIADPHWGARTITDAAFEWGFSSTAHFSRAFRRHFGQSPTEYRAAHRG
jgi:AraC-like DNA-binding protein